MATMHRGSDVFESSCDIVEVTSNHRPDTSWIAVDAQGHEHRWYIGDKPAESYSPNAGYTTPTLVWVKDGEAFYEDDDEPHDVGHFECKLCVERIESPRFTADTTRQYMAGLRHFSINGQPVSEAEFHRRLEPSSD